MQVLFVDIGFLCFDSVFVTENSLFSLGVGFSVEETQVISLGLGWGVGSKLVFDEGAEGTLGSEIDEIKHWVVH